MVFRSIVLDFFSCLTPPFSDQIDSPMSNAIVQDARGTILDEDDNWRIVAFPFRKFFNFNESNAAKLNWSGGVKVMEKLDGSLMILYSYKGA